MRTETFDRKRLYFRRFASTNVPCQRFVLYWQQSIEYEIISILQDDLHTTAHGTGNYSVQHIPFVRFAILENGVCVCAVHEREIHSMLGVRFIRIESCTCALL